MGSKADFVSALGGATAAVGAGQAFTADGTANTITIEAHGRATGQGPLRMSNSGGALPVGLGGIAATGTLTFAANPTANDTCVIGGVTYTFVAEPAVANDIDIGGNASGSLDNLIAAITAGAGEGTAYGTGTVVHPTVTAAAGAGDTMTLAAKTEGVAGNAIATTETFTNAGNVFAAATLTGGQDNSFYVVVIDANTLKLATSYANAINASPVTLDFTGAGTGTHTLFPTVASFSDMLETELREAMSNGNRVGLADVTESRFWDGLLIAL